MELPGVRPRVSSSSTAIDFDLEDVPSKFSAEKNIEQSLTETFKNVRFIFLYSLNQKTPLYSFILLPPLRLYIQRKNTTSHTTVFDAF